MMHTNQALYDQLHTTLIEVNKQIEAIKVDVLNQPPEDVTVYEMKDRNGRPILADMLVAKAQLTSAMAMLAVERSATVRTTGPRRR